MAQIFDKGLRYAGNDLEIWEMAKIFGQWLTYIYIWDRAYVFEKRHKHVASDLNILNMAQICGKWIKYIRSGFTMLEMT